MKPLKLTIQAFAPYAEREELDFGDLGDRSFFLICGPTGAGKTTVLDAMCLALYGDTSGDERDGKQMRSDHADRALPTEVTFAFAIGGNTYRVHRSPEQERPKRRGEGTTTQAAQATLWSVKDGATEVLASKWAEVTAKVESLLGFKSEQFRQVVLLPQGKFRQLLLADSKEREAILETLFKTEVYTRIQDALKASARGIAEQLREADERRLFILEQAEADSVEALQGRRAVLQAGIGVTQKRVEALQGAQRSVQQRLVEAREIEGKLREQTEAVSSVQRLQARSEEIARQDAVLVRAKKAEGLLDAERGLQARQRDAESARKALKEATTALEEAQRAKTGADATLQREQGREAERERTRARVIELNALTDRVKQLDAARKAFAAAQTKATKLTIDRDELIDAGKKANARLEQRQLALGGLQKLVGQVEAHRLKLQQLVQQQTDLTKLRDAQVTLGRRQTEHRRLLEALRAAEGALNGAKGELLSLEEAARSGQAAILAQTLTEGQPCPVCGSTAHPAPAQSDRPLPTEEQLEAAREAVAVAETARDKAREKESSGQTAVVREEASVEDLLKRAGEARPDELKRVEEQVSATKALLADSEAAATQVDAIEAEIGKSKEQQAQWAEALAKTESSVAEAVAATEGLRGTVATHEDGIPETLREMKALTGAQAAAVEQSRSLDAAYESARLAASRADQALAGARAGVEAARTGVEKAEATAREQDEEFLRRLGQAGFKNRDDYEASKRPDRDIKQAETAIEKFRTDLAAALDRLKRANVAASGLAAPDTEALTERAGRIEAVLNRTIERRAALTERETQASRALADFEKNAKLRAALDEQYARLGRISEVANGDNPHRLTFQRFVLGSLLDDVLGAASARLRIMSKGRFTLRRATETADGRRAGGLDLEVDDEYTGTARPVATMSGGESFQASLSLALGLADVVQAYAGGTRLDAVFVDEGFGSLDPEALDLAIKALMDLQKDGRLVGIISHVPELKEWIDAKLEVTADRSGSHACFKVA
jgi:DNA repair protein SbcC/Rad50